MQIAKLIKYNRPQHYQTICKYQQELVRQLIQLPAQQQQKSPAPGNVQGYLLTLEHHPVYSHGKHWLKGQGDILVEKLRAPLVE